MSLRRNQWRLAAAWLLFACGPAPAVAAMRSDTPLGLHSMVYADAPWGFKALMFREAATLGASSIRVDVNVSSIVADPHAERDWRSLDEYVGLARRYRLQVVGVLLGTPWWLAACPLDIVATDLYKCPVADDAAYARYVGEIAAHARGVIDDWEIRNEPDGAWAYLGSAQDYAHEAAAVAAAIHRANPTGRVLLGGAMTLASRPWLRAVFGAGGGRLASGIDIANVHVRGPVARLARTIHQWRSFFAHRRLHTRLWVTEHGYPSDTRFQTDPAFRGGERAQARYLSHSLPTLLRAGADRVFVTERDNLSGAFASEGLLAGTVSDPPAAAPIARRKPAAATFAALARRRA